MRLGWRSRVYPRIDRRPGHFATVGSLERFVDLGEREGVREHLFVGVLVPCGQDEVEGLLEVFGFVVEHSQHGLVLQTEPRRVELDGLTGADVADLDVGAGPPKHLHALRNYASKTG